MPDPRPLAEQIRRTLAADDQRLTDRLGELARDFADVRTELTETADRCADLLRRGLKSEAVHLADGPPPLLELIHAADLEEAEDDWADLCGLYDLPVPPPIPLEAAEALNDAYADLTPLHSLLRTHRRLALARAPLTERLRVVRKLAKAEPEAHFWADDVRAYEKGRLTEIENTVPLAVKGGRADVLRALNAELNSSNWSEKPPKSLRTKVAAATATTGRSVARAALPMLAEALEAAEEADDVAAGRDARTKWEHILKNADLPADAPVLRRAAGPLAWLDAVGMAEDDAREYAAAVGALEAGLDRDDLTSEELSRLRDRVRRLDRDAPEGLEIRARSRAASLEESRRRKWIAVASFSGVGVALLAAGLAFVTVQVMNQAEEDRLAGEVARLTDSGELTSARALFDEHDAEYDRANWLAARSELEGAETAERTRVAALTAALEAAEGAETAEDALRHIERARELARLPDEKLRTAKLHAERTSQQRMRDAAARDRFEQAADAALAAVVATQKTLETDAGPAADAALKTADAALADAAQLANALPDGDAGRTERLRERVAVLRKGLEENRAFTSASARLTEAFDAARPPERVQAYLAAAKRLTSEFPDRPLSRAVAAETAAAGEFWLTAAARADAASILGGEAPRSAADAAAKLARVEAILEQPGADALTTAPAIAARLKAAAARVRPDGDGGLLGDLREMFQLPLLADSETLEKAGGGGTYYLAEPAKTAAGRVRFSRFVSQSRTDSTNLAPGDLVTPNSSRSPQNLLSGKAREILNATETANWAEGMRDLARAIQLQPNLDPFLRWQLLRRVLSDAGEGDVFLAESLQPLLADLQDDVIDPSAMWMDPDRKDAEPSRKAAGRVLERVDAARLGAAFDAGVKAAERARLSQTFAPVPVGWAAMETGAADGGTVSPDPGEGRLWVVEPPSPADGPDGSPRWVRFTPAERRPGRIVFLAPVAVEKPAGLAALPNSFRLSSLAR